MAPETAFCALIVFHESCIFEPSPHHSNIPIKIDMPAVDIVISNKLGLHARAAAKLTQLASSFTECEIFIARKGKRVNAKSIMGVMMLAAGLGVTVTVDAEGPRAEQALADIQALFANKFGEHE